MGFKNTAQYPGVIAAVTDMPNVINILKSTTQPTLGTTLPDGTGTSVVLTSGNGASFPTDNFYITIESEIMYCSSRSTDTLTVTRGALGTSGVSHTSGVNVDAFVVDTLLNQHSAEINAIETALGINKSKILALDIAQMQVGFLN